jgi:hypothetical protein
VNTTGAGDGAVYGITSETARLQVQRRRDRDAIANLSWLKVFRREAMSRLDLENGMPAEAALVREAVEDLLATGRLTEEDGRLLAANLVLPLGSEQGWEVAILDHFRTVAVAIARKVRDGAQGSNHSDRIGGSTFTFTLAPGHPFEADVSSLLRRIRADVQTLWDKVAAHNAKNPPDPERSVRVSFYCGQTLEADDDAPWPPPGERSDSR